ncbi:hypothetical protein H6P81_017719 [Aristolochia fimbriata]|uniref:Uncharacterized protein n=1 Tax=Aristolochia fimbriata TaxID=158543 RepID=A0AAV7E0Y0_ARIFI|nr:hypothetical protein H6P81_017719 [Aristolochia fimbriata]
MSGWLICRELEQGYDQELESVIRESWNEDRKSTCVPNRSLEGLKAYIDQEEIKHQVEEELIEEEEEMDQRRWG